MTDKVHPSFNREAARSRETSTAMAYGGAGDGFVWPSTSRLVEDSEGDLATGALGAFDATTSASSLDVTIATGEALRRGAYLARDAQTTVTLPANATTTIELGWKDGLPDTVLIGERGTSVGDLFDPDDPSAPIWTFTTDGSGVTGATDERTLGTPVLNANRDEEITGSWTFAADQYVANDEWLLFGEDEQWGLRRNTSTTPEIWQFTYDPLGPDINTLFQINLADPPTATRFSTTVRAKTDNPNNDTNFLADAPGPDRNALYALRDSDGNTKAVFEYDEPQDEVALGTNDTGGGEFLRIAPTSRVPRFPMGLRTAGDLLGNNASVVYDYDAETLRADAMLAGAGQRHARLTTASAREGTGLDVLVDNPNGTDQQRLRLLDGDTGANGPGFAFAGSRDGGSTYTDILEARIGRSIRALEQLIIEENYSQLFGASGTTTFEVQTGDEAVGDTYARLLLTEGSSQTRGANLRYNIDANTIELGGEDGNNGYTQVIEYPRTGGSVTLHPDLLDAAGNVIYDQSSEVVPAARQEGGESIATQGTVTLSSGSAVISTGLSADTEVDVRIDPSGGGANSSDVKASARAFWDASAGEIKVEILEDGTNVGNPDIGYEVTHS